MSNFNISTIALAIGLTFSLGAMADSISKNQYKSLGRTIDAEFKLDKAKCKSLAGNANDICIAEAKGRHALAYAELEDQYKPTIQTRYNMRVAKADADYSVAIEKCDDKAGNSKDVCVKEAKAGQVHQMADAETLLKTSKADAVANEKSDDANEKALEKSNEAYREGAADKRAADYVVAKEKCDVLAGDAKGACLSAAKDHFGKK
ncbi:MAG: hypothetical protein ACXW1P_00440 [Methylophilaceae bacterium]